MKVRKAVIPAAGFGTRMLPATKAIPKEMLPILDKPCIQYIVEEAVAAGIEEILIITSRSKRAIEDHFDRVPELEYHLANNKKTEILAEVNAIANLAKLQFIRQREANGLGDALLYAKQFVGNEPFAVLLGDDVIQAEVPVIKQLIDQYDDDTRALVGVQRVPRSETSRYGIIKPLGPILEGQKRYITDIVEKPPVSKAPSDMAVIGRYVLPARILDLLTMIPLGHNDELQLTDGLRALSAEGSLDALHFSGLRHDIGNLQGWVKANLSFALTKPDLRETILSTVNNYFFEGTGEEVV